ncbi:MAG: acetyltransferase [Flavobacterium sp.]|nr:acetyltransferase [Flavobacterium sp.]
MLIVGAKGFAKEVLQVFLDSDFAGKIAFYDDVNDAVSGLLFKLFPILKNEEEVIEYFKTNGNEFTIGIGSPTLRCKLYKKFVNLGGNFASSISPSAQIGHHDVTIGTGSNVLSQAIMSNSSSIGVGCIVYYNVVITHDCVVEDFVELAPNVILLGRCSIGKFTQIGANATILPDVTIGKNVIIGAGSVVTKDIPDNSVALGIPAKVIKNLEPLNDL